MTTDEYIANNQTKTFAKGDSVMMVNCLEASCHKWTCQTDSFIDRADQDVVFLEGFSGYFMCKYLIRS